MALMVYVTGPANVPWTIFHVNFEMTRVSQGLRDIVLWDQNIGMETI